MVKRIAMLAGLPIILTACQTVPTGPSVMVMPKQGKPFDLFQQEDAECRYYAQQALGVNPQDAQTKAFAGSAVAGAAVGAVVGAVARDARAGTAVGLGMGSVMGLGNAQSAGMSLQRRYDITYQQCMYSKGNQVMPQARVYSSGYYYP